MTTIARVAGRLRHAGLLVALLAVGGSFAATAQSASPLARHAIPGVGGFSIAVPSAWKAFDYRQVASSAVVKRIAAENPNLQQLLQAIRDPRSGVRFFAADPAPSGGFSDNVNLVVETIPKGITAVQYGNAATSQLNGLANVLKPIRRQTMQLPAGTSVRLRYGLRFVLDGRKVEVATTQYVLVRGTRAYVVTYTTLRSRVIKLSALFEASARTIRLG